MGFDNTTIVTVGENYYRTHFKNMTKFQVMSKKKMVILEGEVDIIMIKIKSKHKNIIAIMKKVAKKN